ncbi:GNAT family N-acetyltransferase [Candidatus Pacearchaeota archaeon]|nr:GNAT family N-acetyltransferase [Candidatus Pacearchaeota archaeon]
MSIIIRRAIIKDLKDIQNLNLKLCKKEFKEFDNTININFPIQEKGKNYFRERIRSNNCFSSVAVESGKIVGYIAGAIVKAEDYRDIKKIAEAENMFILDDYRNMGIGTKLMDSFIEWCTKKKVKRVRVVISALNDPSIKFHKKNKFEDYDVVLEKKIQ